ncbi:MAG: hypothetical protein IJA32_06340 [Lachnospiraceae bacterium]|nr:hypothetical protein [Lachnospiraceae bacterium]
MTKNDRLIPVITIVVFFNNTHWDGPKSLHEILNFNGIPKELRKRIPDYELIIVSPDLLEKQDLGKMTSTAGYVLGAIKNSDSGEKFKAYVEQNKEVLEHFPGYAAAVINEFCSVKMNDNDLKKEVVNMCQAIIDIKTEGILEGRFKELCSLVEDGILSLEQAAERMGMEPEEFLNRKNQDLMSV